MPDKIEGHRSGEISDALRAWTERVAEILNALIATADIADDAVTYAKIQNAAALSVLGRAGNSVGDLADIVAASNDLLLRRTGNTINFGALTIGMVANSLLTYAKLQDSAGVSVLGRSANSTGVLADITAGANDRLLARTANALAFVQLTVGMFPDSVVTYAKVQNGSAVSLLGRSANSVGVLADIVAGANDRLLSRVGDALAFTQLTAGMFPNSVVTNAMRADMDEETISGRAAGAGTGPPTDLSSSQVLAILGFNLPVTVAPVATTSGTSVSLITTIPSWAREIRLPLNAVSTNGTSSPIIQLGTSGSLVTTGYAGSISIIGDTATVAENHSNGFRFNAGHAADEVIHGIITLIHQGSNVWSYGFEGGRSDADATIVGGGTVSLGGTLTQLAAATVGGANQYDNGSIGITYMQ